MPEREIETTIKQTKQAEVDAALESAPAKVKLFAELCKCDGHLIPITGIKSFLGEELFIATRYEKDPEGWGKDYFTVDVVAKRGTAYIAVGMKDYEIQAGVANGNKQRHDHFEQDTPVRKIVERAWLSGEGMSVRSETLFDYAASLTPGSMEGMSMVRDQGLIDESENWRQSIYRQRGLGHLMTAVSLVALRYLGVDQVQTVSLTKNARMIWAKYGISDNSTVAVKQLTDTEWPMEVISKAFLDRMG